MTKEPETFPLTRREVLKTYAAPSIAVIGVTAVGSFSTSGKVKLKKNGKAKKNEAAVKVEKGK